jgi:MoaA/NifB/PqqE/SkfB family radical SAM enzyme
MINLQKKYYWVNKQDYEDVSGPDWPSYEIFCQHTDVKEAIYQELDSMLSQPQKFVHPSFCVLPFYGTELPTNTPCCLISGNNFDKIKQEMLLGKRPRSCHKCWHLEDNGMVSDRILKNSTLDFYLNKDIHKIFQDCQNGQYETIHYKIDTSNTCNATCITCDENLSTAWAKLKQKNNVAIKRGAWRISQSRLKEKINFHTAKIISFRGGEPFLSKTNFDILERLIEHGNHNCFISFVTNGSFKLSKHQKQILKHFDKLNFCFSIDGTGPVFEYLRYPLQFAQIKQNILYCQDNNIDASVSYTLSNINLLYHSRTVDWFKEQNLSYLLNPVYDLSHFGPSALPQHIKKYIHQNYNHPDIEQYLLNHSPQDDSNFQNFMLEIDKQDTWKNLKLKYYLPELASLLDHKY